MGTNTPEHVLTLIEEAVANQSEFVDLGNCGLTEIPPEIERLAPFVTHLNLGTHIRFRNNLSDASANSFGRNNFFDGSGNFEKLASLPNLEHLELENSSSPPSQLALLVKCPKLHVLNISYNGIGDAGATEIANLAKLTTLQISFNRIGDNGAAEIAKCSSLTTLDISGNRIGDDGAAEIAKCSNLTTLNISRNQIGDAGAAEIATLSNLTSLNIYNNQIGDAGAAEIATLSSLTSLNISGNKIGEAGAAEIATLSNLTSLNISYNQIGEAGAAEIATLSSLTTLDISGNKIGEAGAAEIAKLSSLTTLEISYNQIGDAGAAELATLFTLTSLTIYSNQIGDAGAAEIATLSSLTTLDIYNNQIGDAGAAEIATLSSLTTLDISWNQIGDDGAAELAKLTNLTSLNISGNEITRGLSFATSGRLSELELFGNPIKDVPEYITESPKCISELRLWWEEVQDPAQTERNTLVKLQVLGNGGTGKSCLLDALEHGTYTNEPNSTHGIIIGSIHYELPEEEPIRFYYWDFGGQDIYHGTHTLFLGSQALHLLVADHQTEYYALNKAPKPDRIETDRAVHDQPLKHFIELSEQHSTNSVRVVARNKMDAPFFEPTNNIQEVADKHTLPCIPVSAEKGYEIDTLRSTLAELREQVWHYGMTMPKTWLAVRNHFLAQFEQGVPVEQRLISYSQFEELCAGFNVREVAIPSLLQFLHHTGLVYANKEYLQDKIIVDQQWALDAIYAALDRSSDFYTLMRKHLFGRVPVYVLFQAFGNHYSKKEKWLFLNFMQNSRLCFPLHTGHEALTEQSLLIFPEFLPDQKLESTGLLWEKASKVQVYTFTPEYITHQLIHPVIVELGNKTPIEHIWRNGILVDTHDGMFMVQSNEAVGQLEIHIEEKAIPYYLWLIIEAFHSKKDGEYYNWQDENGTPLDIQKLQNVYNSRVSGYKRAKSEIKDRQEAQPEEKERRLTDVIEDKIQFPPKTIVISYVFEDLNEVKLLEKQFSGLRNAGKVITLRDRNVKDGTRGYDSAIMEMFENADFYIIMLSDDYLYREEHKYVWEKEIPVMLRRSNQDQIPIWGLATCVADYDSDPDIGSLNIFNCEQLECSQLPHDVHNQKIFIKEFIDVIIKEEFLNDQNHERYKNRRNPQRT